LLIGKQFVVSRLVDQYLNNRQNEILGKLLANPADNGHLYAFNLQQLTKDFPQSGLLQALLARANQGEGMHHAAAAFNPKVLYVMMNAYDNLADVSNDQIIQELGSSVKYAGISQAEHAPVLNDFSGGQLKDLIGFEPETGDKVVVADDEQHEVENIAFTPGAEHQDEAQLDILTELRDADTETAPEIIIPEREEEPVAQIEEITNNAVDEPVAEIPAEDHKADLHGSPFEEEIIEWHAVETEEPVEEIKNTREAAPEEEPVTEIPAEDHRADMASAVFEEEIIDFHAQEPGETVSEVDEDSTIEPEMEIAPQDYYPETETPAFKEEISELTAIDEEHGTSEEPAAIKNVAEPLEGIDDEIYDEIADIDTFSFMMNRKPSEEIIPGVAAAGEEAFEEAPAEEIPGEVEYEVTAQDMDEEADELIPESMAATDYFVFEKAESVPPQPEPLENETFVQEYERPREPVAAQPVLEADTNNVSKYHDEKMPYSFMWWLDKTRKEHASVYQPFKLDTTQAIKHTADGTLQQQYYENIFHITTIAELDASQHTIPFDLENKEDMLIKKFIIEEPHISTPSGDKLDNENKAKKSAEDQDEIVTETLARIYVDQMLYHKAINTYKKLMLKFPEKSRYFADQIELLERKIN